MRAALAGGPLDGALVRVAATGALDRSRELAARLRSDGRARALDGHLAATELDALTYAVVDRGR